jgi:2-C-methyl-D-erythritol 4-phosphate cytidylyltransferase/2-C-methyl-D-erythritol 2,4-cyclodiphosphate synthase
VPVNFADAVIVAAGASTRMAGVDKMDIEILGRSILRWSVDAMAAASSIDRIIVVARPERVDELAAADWPVGVKVVAGGAERSHSVRAGVHESSADVVLVHDGARPLVSSVLVDAVAAAAAEHGAAVPVVPVVDSLKRLDGNALGPAVDRDGLVRTQTPQGARRSLLLRAFEAAGDATFTDEAGLLESSGVVVTTVPGDPSNLKVTDQADLQLIRTLAAGRTHERIGFGEDSHSFGPGDGLWLGGVLLEDAPRLYGHSDGDVVLHAVATAVLAACDMGDLGRVFPDSDRATEDISSVVMLNDVLHRARAGGWDVARAQVSVVGARPRLGRHLDAMKSRLAELLSVPTSSVAITASSGNLNGAEGAGRVISASALVTVHRR